MARAIVKTHFQEETCYLKDIKSSGVAGGTSTSTTTHTRVLNTKIAKVGTGSWLTLTNGTTGTDGTNNRWQLEIGTYKLRGSAPAYQTNEQKSFIYNFTDSVYESLEGDTTYWASGGSQGRAPIEGILVVTSPKEFEFHHWVAVGAANGLGLPSAGTGNPQATETYAELEIIKIG